MTSTQTSTTTPLYVVSSTMEFESSGTQEQVTDVVMSYLLATYSVMEEQLSVVVSAGSSQRVFLRSSSSWQADFEIVMGLHQGQTKRD